MKNSFLVYVFAFLVLSCVSPVEPLPIEGSSLNSFFLHPDFRFGNKMIQNLYSDGEALYVASPTDVRYYSSNQRNYFFGLINSNTYNPSLPYFIDKNWAIAPLEFLNSLAIFQKTSTVLQPPHLRKEDFPNANFNYLALNNNHPTYGINGDNLLFAVHSIESPGSVDLIFAKLNIQKSEIGDDLHIDTEVGPINNYKQIALNEVLDGTNFIVRSIFNLHDEWLIHVSYNGLGDLDHVILSVNKNGELRVIESLINFEVSNISDLTTNLNGDYFILSRIGNTSTLKIVKLPLGNYTMPVELLTFQPTANLLRIVDNQMIVYSKEFPILFHIDIEEGKLKAIDTKELGFVTYTDIVEHQGKVYIGTNNGLFYKNLDDFWKYMDAEEFLMGSTFQSISDLDCKVALQ